MPQPVHDIALRFGLEVAEIQRQLHFLGNKRVIPVDEIDSANALLAKHGIAALPNREFLGLPPHHLSHDELVSLVPQLRGTIAAIDRSVSKLNRRIDDLELTDYFATSDEWPELFHESIEYLRSQLSEDPTEAEGKAILDRLVSSGELEPQCDEDISLEDKIRVYSAALPGAIYSLLSDYVTELVDLRDRFDEIIVIAESGKPEATMGPYRQAFIAMMAAFDAAIFDLVACAFETRFDELAPILATPDKIKKELAKLGDNAAGRAAFAEKRLKALGEVLNYLQNDWKVRCMTNGGVDLFPRLIEVVARRNLQLHKRGVVDERYLEVDKDSKKPKYNIYRMAAGQLAYIDERYWQMAQEVCHRYIREVTIWARR